jgi:hypothetical protein
MTQEALKLALEALENSQNFVDASANAKLKTGWGEQLDKADKAITAIKEALREHAMREVQRLGQEIEQEPVVGITAIRTWFKDGRVVTQTLCNSWVDTTPPQRTWVGLTDEEENEYNYLGPDMHWVIQEIAAKLKEKNNA